MDQQITVDKPQPLTLDEAAQTQIVGFVLEAERKGRSARQKFEDDWKECDKLYLCETDPIENPELSWMSNLVLPWSYDAVESAFAHLHSAMIPRNDKVFNLSGRTTDDHPGIHVMEQYLSHAMERARFADQFAKSLRQLLRKNHTCVKVYWRKDSQTSYTWQLVDGVERRVPVELQTYNGVWFDVIDVDNFVFYPIHGDLNKATRIHCTYRFLEDLQAAAAAKEAPYFNINKLSNHDEETAASDPSKKTYQGIQIKEAWIHRIKIGDKVYKNYVATIAADKYLIRFQPNPYEAGASPFIWTALLPDGDCNLGYGILSRGKHLHKAANFLFNQRLNELKIKMHPPQLYWDDQEFNPYNVICRPGAMVRMSQESVTNGNMRPLMQDLSHLSLAYSEVAQLKAEFEEATGITKVVKGLIETSSTATEAQLAHNSSSGKLHTSAFHIDENHLKPWVKLVYLLVYQQLQMGNQALKADLARVTQPATVEEDGQTLPRPLPELVAALPEILPLPEVDVAVIGYQNSLRKLQTLNSLSQALPQLAQSPAAAYQKWDQVAEVVFEALDLDKDRLLANPEERARIDAEQAAKAQAQEQALQAAQAQAYELARKKEEAKQDLEEQKLGLQALELRLKYPWAPLLPPGQELEAEDLWESPEPEEALESEDAEMPEMMSNEPLDDAAPEQE